MCQLIERARTLSGYFHRREITFRFVSVFQALAKAGPCRCAAPAIRRSSRCTDSGAISRLCTQTKAASGSASALRIFAAHAHRQLFTRLELDDVQAIVDQGVVAGEFEVGGDDFGLELFARAQAVAGILLEQFGMLGEEGLQGRTPHRVGVVVMAVVAVLETGQARTELLRLEVADPGFDDAALALDPACQAGECAVSGLLPPVAALHDPAFTKEILRRNLAQQEHVVVEIDEVLGQVFDAPEHRDDRAAVERRQGLLVATEDLGVVDDAESFGVRGAGKPLEDARLLAIGDDVDAPEPGRETQDRAYAPIDFASVVEAGAFGAGRA
ncbi:MAG: hypothetical protein R3F08_09605 [Dokdonella sp.]